MCKANMFTNFIFHFYNIIWIGIPIIYLIMFRLYKSNKKVYITAFKYALIMCLVLYIPKLIGYMFPNSCYNCAINHICSIEKNDSENKHKEVMEVKDANKENNKTTLKTTTSTTTTIKPTTSTTTTSKKTTKTTTTTKTTVTPTKTSKGYDIVTKDGVTYINGLLIVNKTYSIPKNYVPKNTYKDATGYSTVCNNCIEKETYAAWTQMKADAAAVGLNLWIQSGYRPYVLQEKLYNGYVDRDGKAAADKYSARAGYSEHQTGLCFDINNPSKKFNGTVEAKWINDNCYKYGFIIRYPEGKDNETGYMYESWHVRYVGKDLAKTLYNNGDWITLESYLGITSTYAN